MGRPRTTTHGVTLYLGGCRCEVCVNANRERARAAKQRRATLSPDEVPHGLNGYYNYACRCEACKEAGRLDREQAAASRQMRAADVPHGTWSGHSFWGCRCELCHAAAIKRHTAATKRKNDRSRDAASHHRQEWTGPELETLARDDLSHAQVAQMLGRTLQAVRHMRRKLRSDPRIINLAGLPRDPQD